MPVFHSLKPVALFPVFIILSSGIRSYLMNFTGPDFGTESSGLDQYTRPSWCLRCHPADTFLINIGLLFVKTLRIFFFKAITPRKPCDCFSFCFFLCNDLALWLFNYCFRICHYTPTTFICGFPPNLLYFAPETL